MRASQSHAQRPGNRRSSRRLVLANQVSHGTVELGHPVRDLGVAHQEGLPRLLGLVKLLDFNDETSPVRLEPIGLRPPGALPDLHSRLEAGAGVA